MSQERGVGWEGGLPPKSDGLFDVPFEMFSFKGSTVVDFSYPLGYKRARD